MNIFATSKSPRVSARSLPDKLVVKMTLESAQMLCTALRRYMSEDYCDTLGLYKSAYVNHPCTVWARENRSNYGWLLSHFRTLCDEYTKRYNKTHACERLLLPLTVGRLSIPEGKLTPFAQAMPDVYKNEAHTQAYRDYMVNEKHYAVWKHNEMPEWWARMRGSDVN